MKKYFVLILLILPIVLNAQPKAIKSIFDKYNGKKGFTSVNLNDPGDLFGDAVPDKMKDIVKGVENVIVLTCEENDSVAVAGADEFSSDLKSISVGDDYKTFLTVNSDGEYVRMYYKKDGKKIKEFVVIVAGEKESVLVYITGDLDLSNLKKLGKVFGKKGF